VSNGQLVGVTIAPLLAHVAALAVFWLHHHDARPIRVLIGLVAACVLAYLATHPGLSAGGVDWAVLGLGLVEAAVLVAAILYRRSPIAGFAAWTAFAGHFAISLCAVAFALLFRINRLF